MFLRTAVLVIFALHFIFSNAETVSSTPLPGYDKVQNKRNPEEDIDKILKEKLQRFNNLQAEDDRREQELLDEKEKVIPKLKNDLKTMKTKEEQDRKKEPPASGMASVERKKEEFVYNKLVEAIEKQIGVVEKMLPQKSFLDKEYAHQKKILTDRWGQLESLKLRIEKRRVKESSIRQPDRTVQQQTNKNSVQQQQQQQQQQRSNNNVVQQQRTNNVQGIQNTKNFQQMNTPINKKRLNGK